MKERIATEIGSALRKKPGRKDVATRAGVSAATVSLVLNNRDQELRISPNTRDKVLAAAKELGYNPNPLMQSILRRKTNTISLWMPREAWNSVNPYWMGVVQDVREGCSAYGYDLLLHHDRNDEDIDVALSRILGGLVDGVIITPTIGDPMASGLALSHVPTVAIDNEFPSLPCIRSNSKAGIESLVDHLLDLGHTQFAYLDRSGVPLHTDVERREAIRNRLLERSVVLAETHIHGTALADSDTLAWIKGLNPMPTAIMCFNDIRAQGLVSILFEAGYRVPEDVSVTGFDGMSFESPWKLTSFAVGHEQICFNAVSVLKALMDGETIDETLFEVPGSFIQGTTSGPVPGSQ